MRILIILMIVQASVSCSNSVDQSINSEFLFSLKPENQIKIEHIIKELQDSSIEENELTEEIFNLPVIHGDTIKDTKVVAEMYNIVIKGLILEERSAIAFLKANIIRKHAYYSQQSREQQKKLLDRKSESLFMNLKDKIIIRHFRSVNREYAELRKKLGYKLVVNSNNVNGRKISNDLLFSLDKNALANVENSVLKIRQYGKQCDLLTKEIQALALNKTLAQSIIVTKMVDLVMRGLDLEQKITEVFIRSVQIQRLAYLQQQYVNSKKILTDEQGLLFIGMLNDTIESYNKSVLGELI